MARVNVLQFSKFVLLISCLSILDIMVYQDLRRFMKNDDSSSITFQKFNGAPTDKYPALTLCIPVSSNVPINLDQWIISVKEDYISKNLSLLDELFYPSHQDSSKICYSMSSEFKHENLKFMEEIILDTEKLPDGILMVNLNFEGQTVRSFGKEIFKQRLELIKTKLIGNFAIF